MLDKNIKYALVLEGGGLRGSFQAGAIAALNDNGYKFSAVAGTSIGSLNGCFVAMKKFEELKNVWMNFKLNNIFKIENEAMEKAFQLDFSSMDFLELAKAIKGLAIEGGLEIQPLLDLIDEHIDEDEMRASGVDFGLVTCNLTDLKPEEIMLSDMPKGTLKDYLMASCYLPGFKRRELMGKQYLDGGFYNNLPTRMLVDKGYEDIIEIHLHFNTIRLEPKKKFNRHTIKVPHYLGPVMVYDKDRVIKNFDDGYEAAKKLLLQNAR